MTRLLILVKHSLPTVVPELPPSQWRLSDIGRQRARLLPSYLSSYQPDVVVSSTEIKAMETGRILGTAMQAPFETAEGLHEHERDASTFRADSTAWETAVAAFFARPSELVLGHETANQAGERFRAAIGQVLVQHPEQNVVIVAHGTVISLFAAPLLGAEPFDLWGRLGLPSFIVLTLPALEFVETVELVED